MNILLTGATGFLGSHLLKALLRKEYDVSVLKRSTSNCRRIDKELDRCRLYDVDRVELEEVFRVGSFDAVIHCATEYKTKANQASDVVNSNLLFPLQILETAISARCLYFINTDSFFTKQLPERFYNSHALYAAEYTLSKYQFREWGRMRAIERKINFVNLQMEHIYGPDDSPEKFVSFLVHSMRSGAKKIDLTDGIQIRDFIHVEDAITAYLAVLGHLDNLTGYHSFEVGTGVSRTVREFIEEIHGEIGSATTLNFGSIPRKDTEIMFSTARIHYLQQMGWQIVSSTGGGRLAEQST